MTVSVGYARWVQRDQEFTKATDAGLKSPALHLHLRQLRNALRLDPAHRCRAWRLCCFAVDEDGADFFDDVAYCYGAVEQDVAGREGG